MKVAIIQNVPINDHRMVHTDGIARELSRRGYQVDVINQKSSADQQFENTPYRIIGLPGDTYGIKGQIRFAYKLSKFLRKEEYNIIHAKNPFSSVLPALLLKKRGLRSKIVYDVRGLWVDFGVYEGVIPAMIGPTLNNIDIYCMNNVDGVISISNELKKVLVERKVKKNKIQVIIGDGVDLERIARIQRKDIRKALDIKGKVIGYVGGIGRSRFSDKIIKSFKLIKEKSGSNVNLVMIGYFGEGEKPYFEELIKKEKLDKSVFFTGFVPHDEALAYMKSFDIAVSYHEKNLPIFNVAVPTKILEYLATECCIVTTNHRMYKNLLTDGENAFLTQQNEKSFAKQIYKILQDEKSNKFVENLQKTAKIYSTKKIVDKIEKIYQKFLQQSLKKNKGTTFKDKDNVF